MDPGVRAAPSFSERLYARLLVVYPSGHRRQYGPLMLQLFRDQYRDARREGRRGASWQLWWRVAAELMETAIREHVEAIKEASMDKYTGRINSQAVRVMGMLVASVLIAGSLIGKAVIYEVGGSPALALSILLGAHLAAGLLIDRLIGARGTAFLLMTMIIGATLLPLLWVPDGATWLRENPLVGGIFVVILAGWYQTDRPRWPLYIAGAILALGQILVSFI